MTEREACDGTGGMTVEDAYAAVRRETGFISLRCVRRSGSASAAIFYHCDSDGRRAHRDSVVNISTERGSGVDTTEALQSVVERFQELPEREPARDDSST